MTMIVMVMFIMEVMLNDNDGIVMFMMIKISRRRSVDEESNMAKWIMMALLGDGT